MYPNFTRTRLSVALAIIVILSAATANAQLEPASPPIADPADTRFVGVHEDFTTPSLGTSTLKPAPPLSAMFNDYSTHNVELLQLQWRWGDPIDVYVVKPKGVKKPPVILYLYGYPADTDVFKNEAWQRAVTKDGFAAVAFVSALTGQRYHDRPMQEWFVSELQECLAVSAHDVQMVLNYLDDRGDLDMENVGMFAEGSGASIGILASAVDSRIKALDAMDPWGDWPTWMAKSPFVPEDERPRYITAEFLKKASALDPVTWLPKVQARNLLLQYASFNPTTPLSAQDIMKAAVPAAAEVRIYKSPQEFATIMNRNKIMDWLHAQLGHPGGTEAVLATDKH